ncbi:hypothetical protein NHG28_06405 [Aerococcaceae bacterium NML201209]|nr:hypothetical protein [Aerococcaceae bacterium NML201209]
MKTALKTLACIATGLVVGVAIKRVNDKFELFKTQTITDFKNLDEYLYKKLPS